MSFYVTRLGKRKKIIHKEASVGHEKKEKELDKILGNYYEISLKLSREINLQTNAFLNISTGANRFP